MRLIDADELMQKVLPKNEDAEFRCVPLSDILNAPTVYPDSLVRPSARWMSVGHKMARICSHCFSDEPYKFADHDADIYDFCPHCGAKMEGTDDEERS